MRPPKPAVTDANTVARGWRRLHRADGGVDGTADEGETALMTGRRLAGLRSSATPPTADIPSNTATVQLTKPAASRRQPLARTHRRMAAMGAAAALAGLAATTWSVMDAPRAEPIVVAPGPRMAPAGSAEEEAFMEVDMARLLSGGDADPARAVQNLATGQTLEAARHYRALAIARPDDAAFENISAILARRVAQRCRKQELDGMPCTGEQQP